MCLSGISHFCLWEQGLDFNNTKSNWHLTRRSLSLNHRLSELEGATQYQCLYRGLEVPPKDARS